MKINTGCAYIRFHYKQPNMLWQGQLECFRLYGDDYFNEIISVYGNQRYNCITYKERCLIYKRRV